MIKKNSFRLFCTTKDGGEESKVWAHWLISWKPLGGIVLLHFQNGSRDAYHEHAFNSISWLLKGRLLENHIDGEANNYFPSLKPIFTKRKTFHKVISLGNSWVISFRGPWVNSWREYIPSSKTFKRLTHGRKEI